LFHFVDLLVLGIILCRPPASRASFWFGAIFVACFLLPFSCQFNLVQSSLLVASYHDVVVASVVSGLDSEQFCFGDFPVVAWMAVCFV
jgi:hypothetical protein